MRVVLHRKIGIHPLEPGVFAFEFPDALELGDAQATVSALPVVVGRLATERSDLAGLAPFMPSRICRACGILRRPSGLHRLP